MKNKKFTLFTVPPSADEFIDLRRKIGWDNVTPEQTDVSLNQSLFNVTVRDNGVLVAMGRVVGDGIMYFYVQDVVVEPSYQGFGLGKRVMNEIENYLQQVATKGATIGLLAAKEKEGFYQQFGYLKRDGQSLGLGMCKFI